mmetsp:Transcript_68733/g.102170  ORF Transcript_68733/g.102170 Transcript_68733/m.102170 type:complete len:559 (-) Transcript_68733:99-1775(-)
MYANHALTASSSERRRPKLFDLLSTDETQEEINWSSVLSRLQSHPREASWFVPGCLSSAFVRGGFYHDVPPFSEKYQEEEEKEPTVGWTALHTAMYLNPPYNVIQALLQAFPPAASIESARGDTPLHLVHFSDVSAQVTKNILEVSTKWDRHVMFRKNSSGLTPLDLICSWWGARMGPYDDGGGEEEEDDEGWNQPYDGGSYYDEYYGTEKKLDAKGEWKRKMLDKNPRNSNQWEKIHILLEAAFASLHKNKKLVNVLFRPLHAAAYLGCQPNVLWHLNESSGRIAIKEEDECRQTPLSVAASSSFVTKKREKGVIRMLLSLFPEAASIPNEEGRLPLHLALESGKKLYSSFVFTTKNESIEEDSNDGSTSSFGHDDDDDSGYAIEKIIQASPQALQTRDITTFLYPFMTAAVLPGDLTTTYLLLRSAPILASGLADDPPWLRLEKCLWEKWEKVEKNRLCGGGCSDEIEIWKGTVKSLQVRICKLEKELNCVKKENQLLKKEKKELHFERSEKEPTAAKIVNHHKRLHEEEEDSPSLEEFFASEMSVETTESKRQKY